jgi:hypothetical protein
MAFQARFGLRYNDIRAADCSSSEAVGDFVYVSGPQVSNRDQVRKASPADYDKMPAVGVIISKSSSTTCLVQWMGETPPIFSGLSSGETYFLGADARLAERPPVPVSGYMFAQPIAVALAADRAYIRPENTIIQRIA